MCLGRPGGTAFSRLELLVLVGAIVLVAGIGVLNFTGERGRIASCKHNLRILGDAMQEYASSHGGALPPASIAQLGLAWDSQICRIFLTRSWKRGLIVRFNVRRTTYRGRARAVTRCRPTI